MSAQGDSRVGCILQARMGSTRLPGKVLKSICGKPMLEWIIDRLRKVDNCTLVLATSGLDSDDSVAELGERLNVPVFRGSETDVLDRYFQCATSFGFTHVLRATGDNPFVAQEYIPELLALGFENQLDYATYSTSNPPAFPIGSAVEFISTSALSISWLEGKLPHHREHVNEFILENPNRFKAGLVYPRSDCDASGMNLTVDTQEQFEQAAETYAKFYSSRKHTEVLPLSFAIRERIQGREGGR